MPDDKKKKVTKEEKPKEKGGTKKSVSEVSGFKVRVEEEYSNTPEDKKPELKPETPAKEVPTEKETEATDTEVETVDEHKEKTKKDVVVQTQPQASPQPAQAKKSSVSFITLFLAFIMSLIIGGALVGGIFYYQTNVANTGDSAEIEESPNPKYSPPAETSSPQSGTEGGAEVELTEITIQVLNGSGIAGEAGKVEVLLVNAGFSDIETANAISYDYEETEISVKEDISDQLLDEVLDAIDTYTTSEGQALDEDNEFDVVIIVGTSKS